MTLPLIIDSFAGGGGASTGIERALGRSPDVAINHSGPALALHAANHPETLHLNSDIWAVEPREVMPGRHIGLLWASPDCKHFSKAKGGAPRDRNIRDLAWVVVKWAEHRKPDVIIMENVEEFTTWGPIDNEGQPIRAFIGQTFADWKQRLRRAGYKLQHRELRACDYGAPTIRKRFFLIARRDGLPLVWPKPTHGDPKSREVRTGKLKPWRTAAECIDFAIPCPSIFDTGAEVMAKHGLRAVRPLAENTLARIARGMKRYVLDAERPFLVQTGYGERPGQAPRTMYTDVPLGTVVAGGVKHALVAPSITRFNGGATGQDLRDPLATVTANSWIKRPGGAAPLGLITPALATFYGHGDGRGIRSATIADPLRTITVENRHALIAPSLVSVAHGDSGGRREYPLSDPYGVVLAGGISHALTTPFLAYAQHGGAVRSPLDPLHTVTASRKDQNAVIIPAIVGCGGRAAQSRPRGGDEPFATITAKADACLSAAYLAQHHTGATGHDPREPLSTVAATGSHQMPVAAFIAPWFAKYYGTGDGARSDDPLHTVTTKDRMGHLQATLEAPPFIPDHHARARQVADFLRAHGAWDGGEFVTLIIDGQTFVVVDIGMRMLTPRELFNAQGFPPDYVIEGQWVARADDWHWVPFTKDVQVSCCGNSVCPDLAHALVAANCQHLMQERAAA
jgi:DNA (cytosine-5)-methyltransferase 1